MERGVVKCAGLLDNRLSYRTIGACLSSVHRSKIRVSLNGCGLLQSIYNFLSRSVYSYSCDAPQGIRFATFDG